MAAYELAPAADRDLQEIAWYTIETWGVAQARRYEAQLKRHLAAIGKGKVRARVLLKHRPNLLVSRCQHHYIFYLSRERRRPLIIGVFHESMDLLSRVRKRLKIEFGSE
jgi:toxin ParE1/3/4